MSEWEQSIVKTEPIQQNPVAVEQPVKEKKKLKYNKKDYIPPVYTEPIQQIFYPPLVTEPIQPIQLYFYPPPTLGMYGWIDWAQMNIVVDQMGNQYQLPPNQFLENGIIMEYDEFEEGQDYFQNYGQQNDQQKIQYRKKKAKKAAPPVQKPVKIENYVYKKDIKNETKTEEQKIQDKLGSIKKEKKYNLKEMQQLEADSMQAFPKRFTQLDIERENLNLVLIGHVDAGKSTLSGRILVETGQVDEQEISNYKSQSEKNKMQGWYLAYVMDINEEERAKGKTVECEIKFILNNLGGKAHFQLSQKRFTLFDAPGHKNYVPNMIMGACQADIAGLIISSKMGEFESGFERGGKKKLYIIKKGQTTEHAQLAKALGVQHMWRFGNFLSFCEKQNLVKMFIRQKISELPHIICIVSKMDQCSWSYDRYKQIQDSVTPFLINTCGIKSIEWVPIDSYNGHNINSRVDQQLCNWYTGLTLFEILNKCPVPPRNNEGPLRLPVLDTFVNKSNKQFVLLTQLADGSLFIYGKVESGCIKTDYWVASLPQRKELQIMEIYDSKDREIFYAATGENIKLRVKNVSEDEVQRGSMICWTDNFCQVTTDFIAKVQILELPEHKQGYQCIIHLHTVVQEVDISSVDAVWEESTKRMVKENFLKSGQSGMVKISQLCLDKYDSLPSIGRFTLRDENRTIAFGEVVRIKPAQGFEFLIDMEKAKQAEKKI